MGTLDGKVAVITGASKGIGRVMSLLFAKEGAAVVCAARSGALVDETATLVTKAGGRAVAVTGDAAKEADVKRIVAAGLKAFGKIERSSTTPATAASPSPCRSTPRRTGSTRSTPA